MENQADVTPAIQATPIKVKIAAAVVIVAANAVLYRARSRPALMATNFVAASSIIILARRDGATADDLGLSRSRLGAGLCTGLAVGLPFGFVLAFATLLAPLRKLHKDESIASASALDMAYEVALRIPLATAACEELIFRSGLEALFSRRSNPWQATTIASSVFGLWHVLPTLKQLRSRGAATPRAECSVRGRIGTVIVSTAVTFIAGAGLSALRGRTGSIIAPMLVHAAANGSGYVAAWYVSRERPGSGASPARRPTHLCGETGPSTSPSYRDTSRRTP